jgi:hypothetical protein
MSLETRDRWLRYIEENQVSYRTLAAEHYRRHGRGAFVVEEADDPNTWDDKMQKASYLTLGRAEESLDKQALHLFQLRVDNYDVQTTVLFSFWDPEVEKSTCYEIVVADGQESIIAIGDARTALSRVEDYDELVETISLCESLQGRDTLLPYERVIFDVLYLEGQVFNGGFLLFFEDPAAERIDEFTRALEAIKATKLQELLAKACQIFPADEMIRDLAERQAFIEEMEYEQVEFLQELEGEVMDDDGVLRELLWSYWEANRPDVS